MLESFQSYFLAFLSPAEEKNHIRMNKSGRLLRSSIDENMKTYTMEYDQDIIILMLTSV